MTWQQLMDSIQRAYEISVGWDSTTAILQADENGFSFWAPAPRPIWNTRWYDDNGFSHDEHTGLTLPGFPGLWTYSPSAFGEFFTQPTGNPYEYTRLSKGPNGSIQSGVFISPHGGDFMHDVFGQNGLTGFVKEVGPIVAYVGSIFVAGAGIEALGTTAIGEGAAVGTAATGTAEAGAGWVSAEAGASYAGGMAADAAIAPAVIGGAETFAVAAPAEVTVSALPEAGAGWVSAEGGVSYAGGLAADGVVPAALPSAGGLLDKITALTPADILKYGGQVSTAVKTVQSVIGKPKSTPPRVIQTAVPGNAPAPSSSMPILLALGAIAAFLFS